MIFSDRSEQSVGDREQYRHPRADGILEAVFQGAERASDTLELVR